MNFATRPPPFLHTPGVPVIPWPQWRRAFQTYIDAAARDAVSELKKALLLNALGVEGLLCYLHAVEEEPQPGDYRKTSEDAYTTTPLQLDELFNPQQFSCNHVDTVFSRRVQDGVPARRPIHGNGQHGGLPPRSSRQDGAGILPSGGVSSPARSASASSSAGWPAGSSPATSSARAGSCFRCGSSQHWADSSACPARSRTCARCGKRGHFDKVCRSSGDPPAASSSGPSTVTNAVTVRQEDAIPIPAASPSSPGGDGLEAPVECPAVVPTQSDSFPCTARVLEPPGSLTAPVQCPAAVPSHSDSFPCTEYVSEPPGFIHALYEHSSDVSSPHVVLHIFAAWNVLSSAGKCRCTCTSLLLCSAGVAPSSCKGYGIQTSANTSNASPTTEATQSA